MRQVPGRTGGTKSEAWLLVLDERRAPVARVPRLGGCLTDVPLHSSLISTWT